ncbi:MAG: MlaD family protein [Geminicoccaceae bacterium]
MSKANPAVIGAFVIGAIALIVIGLLVYGGAGWFVQRNQYVAYFPGSVKGLRVGAPVDFRGVSIGQVTDIRVIFDPEEVSARIPVIIEFDPTQIQLAGAEQMVADDTDRLIEGGLRAQLQSQSLLTGLLFVNLDFHPDAPARLVGGDEPYPEIPTIPSGLEQLQQSAGDIAMRLPDMVDRLAGVLTSIDEELSRNRGDIRQIVADVATTAEAIRDQTPEINRIMATARDATGDVRRAAATLEQILQTNRDAIGALIDEWTVTAGSVRRMADQVNAAIAENRPGLRDFTQTGLYEYTGLAQDAQRLVDQMTRVAEELERDPARFLFGDRTQGVATE